MTRRLLLILMIITVAATVQAQYVKVRDLEGWAGAKMRYKANDWSFSLEEQFRMEQNISKIDDILTEFEASYGGFGNWDLGAGIRGIKHKTSSGDYENRVRFHIQSEYSVSPDKLSFGLRIRYQNRYDADESKLLNVMRIKASVRFNPRGFPVDPYTSLEGFALIPGRQPFGYPAARWALGGIWKLNKKHHLRIFYHLEYNKEEFYPLWIHRIGTRYDLRI